MTLLLRPSVLGLAGSAVLLALLFTTECVVVEKKDDKPAPADVLRVAAWAG